jgi:hypothetical protein
MREKRFLSLLSDKEGYIESNTGKSARQGNLLRFPGLALFAGV